MIIQGSERNCHELLFLFLTLLFFGGASKRANDTIQKINFAILFAAEQKVKQLEKKLFDANIFYLSFYFGHFHSRSRKYGNFFILIACCHNFYLFRSQPNLRPPLTYICIPSRLK